MDICSWRRSGGHVNNTLATSLLTSSIIRRWTHRAAADSLKATTTSSKATSCISFHYFCLALPIASSFSFSHCLVCSANCHNQCKSQLKQRQRQRRQKGKGKDKGQATITAASLSCTQRESERQCLYREYVSVTMCPCACVPVCARIVERVNVELGTPESLTQRQHWLIDSKKPVCLQLWRMRSWPFILFSFLLSFLLFNRAAHEPHTP